MPAFNAISPDKLLRLIGLPSSPQIIDVRIDDDFAADPHSIPGALRRPHTDVARWAGEFRGRSTVITCKRGAEKSSGVAAWLRQDGVPAENLEGGVEAWLALGLPVVPEAKLPARDGNRRTVWVTRQRPKVDRIACPWLIRRFVDPSAVFLFVPPSDVRSVAAEFGGSAFDIEGEDVVWSHRGERCTFDVMVEELGLSGFGALGRLAAIVRGADTGRPEIVPEAAGLLAASLGLSRMFADDVEQLEAGMLLYDAFYRWCRDAIEETHNWASHAPRGTRRAGEVQ